MDPRETLRIIRECYDKCDKLNKVKKLPNERNFKTSKRRNRYLNSPISITHTEFRI